MKSKTLITLILIASITPAIVGLFTGCSVNDQAAQQETSRPTGSSLVAEKPEEIMLGASNEPAVKADEIAYPRVWRDIAEERNGPQPEVKVELSAPATVTSFDNCYSALHLPYPPAKPSATHSSEYYWRGFPVFGGAGNMDGDIKTPVLGDTPTIDRLFSNAEGLSTGFRGSPDSDTASELMHISADEVWVIIKPETQPQAAEEQPGCGAMVIEKEGKEDVPLPLKHTDVRGDIAGYIASVEVTQQFHNPFDEKIEAVYVFPLPQNAAIHDFIMTIGERKIRGIIRKRQEAEQIYAQARAQGHVASLLTQERPNIFTQKVANIEPGKNIDVSIRYFNTLAYVDGWYEFVFPMVVGPRFNPPHITDGVGAVAHGNAGASGQSTEVQYLAPNQRSGHDIALSVDIHAGVDIEEIHCVSHVINTHDNDDTSTTVAISDKDSIPNKDFVLRYKVAGDEIKSAFMTHTDNNGSYFTMMLYPPAELSDLDRAPMEMIFVLDCSGSMSGVPMQIAKSAIKRAIKKLRPDDTFQVIRFSSNASQLGPAPVIATKENIQKGLDYVDSLNGGGGTMMIEGIKAALDFEHDPDRLRLVSFMTDGYIGNETEILGAIHQKLGSARIFSFGVGSSVNSYLLDRMAKLGKGAVAYIGLQDSSAEIIDLFYDRISHPALMDVSIDWGTLDVADVYPRQIPDLFVGRPVILTGRFTGTPGDNILVSGTVAGVDQHIAIPAPDDSSTHEGIAAVWARKKIEQLTAWQTYDANPDLAAEIETTALTYGLMSAYTAFVAVDSTQTTEGDHGVTVAVPVPVPEGVRYDTTVSQ